MESLAPVLVDEMELLVDLLPADTHVLVLDPERARRRAHDLVATSEEFLGASWAAAAGGGTAPIDLGAASYRSLGDVRAHALGAGQGLVERQPVRDRRRRAADGSTPTTCDDGVPSRALPMQAVDAVPRRRRPGDRRHRASGATRRLPGGRRAPGPRPGAADGRGAGRARRRRPGWSTSSTRTPPGDDVVTVTCGALAHGFVDDANRLALLTGEDLSGQTASTRDMRQDAGAAQAARSTRSS